MQFGNARVDFLGGTSRLVVAFGNLVLRLGGKSVPIGSRFLGPAARFSKGALLLSSSALCLLPATGPTRAGSVENHSFISLYGGFLFSGGESSVDFNTDPPDTDLAGLGKLEPGEYGGMVGMEAGRPLTPLLDVRASGNAVFLAEDEASDASKGASGRSRLNYQYLDLELGYRPGVIDDNVRLFAGPRLLHAGNDVAYDLDGTSGKVGNYDHDIELWGGGLRAGAQATVPLGNSGAWLSLLGAGSAILAHSNHDYSFEFSSGGSPTTGTDGKDSWRGVFNAESVAGVSLPVTDNVELQFGYQVQHWWNITTTLDDVESGDTSIMDEGEGNVLVHGPMARITVKLP